MTAEKERVLIEKGYFFYQGNHFKPVGQFQKEDGDFFEITRRLKRDTEFERIEENQSGQYGERYSHAGFYEASPVKDADLFLCLENQKVYVPCEYGLQEYLREIEKKPQKRRTR